MQGPSMDVRKSDQLLNLIKRRLLVVDEDLEDLLYYSAVLQHQGYEVRSIPPIRTAPRGWDASISTWFW